MFSSAKFSALTVALVAAATAQAYTGDVTWYNTGLGACGLTNNDSQLIGAVAHGIFDTYPGHTANPNNNPICKHKAKVTCNGKSVTVLIRDRCAGCNGNDIDLSPAAFQQLAALSVGRIHNCVWSII